MISEKSKQSLLIIPDIQKQHKNMSTVQDIYVIELCNRNSNLKRFYGSVKPFPVVGCKLWLHSSNCLR